MAETTILDGGELLMSETPPRSAPAARAEEPTRRFFSLKPYGNELLTRSGDFWIFSARLIIVAMALAEAIAWGYVGSLMSSRYPLVTAAIAAGFIFLLIWIIDTSFMTLDLRSGRYEEAITGRSHHKRLERLKLFAGVGARVAIVTLSLMITAPFLAQAIFSGDVKAEMERQNAAGITTIRQRIESRFQSRIDELTQERKILEEQRVREAAGVGLSGRHGRGPALETIERQLADKNEEIRMLGQSRVEALRQFDALSTEQLKEHYGLEVLKPGVHSSAAILAQLAADPQFGQAEIALRAFLAFLFLGLLILKAFQPRSISIYFSEQLHSLYDQYRKGIFDSSLPAPERASLGGSIDPLRFEDWCLNGYSTIRAEERERQSRASTLQRHEMMISQWRTLEESAVAELRPIVERHDAAISSIHQLEEQIQTGESAIDSLSAELKRVESSHGSMMRHVEGDTMDGAAFSRAMDALRQLDEKRRELSREIRTTRASIDGSFRKLERNKAEAATLKREIHTKEVVIADAQQRISDERMHLARTIRPAKPSEDDEIAPQWSRVDPVGLAR